MGIDSYQVAIEYNGSDVFTGWLPATTTIDDLNDIVMSKLMDKNAYCMSEFNIRFVDSKPVEEIVIDV